MDYSKNNYPFADIRTLVGQYSGEGWEEDLEKMESSWKWEFTRVEE